VQVIYWSLYPNGLKIEEKFEHLGSVVNQFRNQFSRAERWSGDLEKFWSGAERLKI
jgi:hypothetical protein